MVLMHVHINLKPKHLVYVVKVGSLFPKQMLIYHICQILTVNMIQ